MGAEPNQSERSVTHFHVDWCRTDEFAVDMNRHRLITLHPESNPRAPRRSIHETRPARGVGQCTSHPAHVRDQQRIELGVALVEVTRERPAKAGPRGVGDDASYRGMRGGYAVDRKPV